MANEEKGEKNPQMTDEIVTEQVNGRIAWFLAGAYPGWSKRKRIALDFGVAQDTVKGWLNGSGPGRQHFDAMVRRWGRDFLKFVYPSTDQEHIAEMAILRDLAASVARMEERLNVQVVVGKTTRLAPPTSEGALPAGDVAAGRHGISPTNSGSPRRLR